MNWSCRLLIFASVVSAQSSWLAAAEVAMDIEEIISLGTRNAGRTATDSLVPVDVISALAIEGSGAVDTNDMLRKLAPSFNLNNTTTSDGQDLMRPASLRGMSPDQILVLVNGKRRHQFAMVAVQENVGRGSAGTDLSAIPLTAIKRVEILRDGAAAQYGSDAIAGVINIVLKDAEVGNLWGQYRTTTAGDGTSYKAGGHFGVAFERGGHLNLTYEVVDQETMNRAAKSDWFGASPIFTQRVLVGEPQLESHALWFNVTVPLGGGEAYAFGGYSDKQGESLGFYRGPDDGRVWSSLYPQGVTPELGTRSEDSSIALGYRTTIGAWDGDVSVAWGENRMEYRNSRSLNASYGPDSPTQAYDGALVFDQLTVNADILRQLDLSFAANATLALGLEWRTDGFQQQAGEAVSYARGDTLCDENFVNADDAGKDPLTCLYDSGSGSVNGTTTPGMQGFQGYSPAMVLTESRSNWAAYGDAEMNFTDRLHAGFALRYENYSDFGDTLNGKMTARYDLTDALALRAGVSTGFRAPGMQQSYFTQRSISLDNGELADLVTIRPGDELANELGFEHLEEEVSQNFSFGFAYTGSRWTSTLDAYQVNIENRVAYSGNISRTGDVSNPIDTFFDRHSGPGEALDGVKNVSVFTNAVDTQTQGFDWVNEWGFDFQGGNSMVLEASFHLNKTTVEKINTTSDIVPVATIFNDSQALLLTDAQPQQRAVMSATFIESDWSGTARANYYGSVSSASYGTPKNTWAGKTLVDITGQWDVSRSVQLSAGVLNIFDTYPDAWGANGAPFTELGFNYGWTTFPFSLAGREYYLRAAWRF